jgi:hypothetical protein
MSGFFWKVSKYNGPHDCPKCGAPSEWRGIDADTRTIRVACSESCGVYEATFSRLSCMSYFNPNQSA